MTRIAPKANHVAVVEHYARLAPKYDRRWDRYSRATLDAVVRQIDFTHVHSLLDVACGTGIFAEMTRRIHPGIAITGVDLSPDMIAVARSRLSEDDAVAWHVGTAENLPVGDEKFDIVTCANAFHLVADPEQALSEFHRVLKPGGSVVLVDWCREFHSMRLVLVMSRVFGRQYRRVATRRELNQMLDRAGLTIRHEEKFKATSFWGMMCIAGEKVTG